MSFLLLVTTYGLDASLNQVSQKQYVLPESIVAIISGDLDPWSPSFCYQNIYYQAPGYRLKQYNYNIEEIIKIFTEIKKRLPSSDDLTFYIAILKVFDFLEFKQDKNQQDENQKVEIDVVVNYISNFFKSKVDIDKKECNSLKLSEHFWL